MMASSRRPTPTLGAPVGLLFVLVCGSTIRGSISADGGVEQGDATTTPSASQASRGDGSPAAEGGAPTANAGIYCQLQGPRARARRPMDVPAAVLALSGRSGALARAL